MDDLQAKTKMIAKARSEGGREKLRIKPIGTQCTSSCPCIHVLVIRLFIIQLVNWPT